MDSKHVISSFPGYEVEFRKPEGGVDAEPKAPFRITFPDDDTEGPLHLEEQPPTAKQRKAMAKRR